MRRASASFSGPRGRLTSPLHVRVRTRLPLCRSAFSQLAPEREGQSQAFSCPIAKRNEDASSQPERESKRGAVVGSGVGEAIPLALLAVLPGKTMRRCRRT